MNQRNKDVILEALALKETSTKRAQAGKQTSPRFKEVYDAELLDLADARKEIMAIKVTQ